jgi:crotonobetainyl-CoA:carnitine CoA-transferase CaiB-like acyl-CoA transferase
VLNGLRVLDVTMTSAGGYCTKLLVDAWADVVELIAFTDERFAAKRLPPEQVSDLRAFLGASKQAQNGELIALPQHARGYDLLVEDLGPGAIDIGAVRRHNPGLVVVSISPFGHSGPWSQLPANEFILQAWSSSIFQRGTPERPPLQAGGELGMWAAAAFAAVAGLGAWRIARKTGRGEHVDVSLLESTYSIHHPYLYLAEQLGGGAFGGVSEPMVEVPSVARTSDGFVGFTTITAQQWSDFLILIERADLLEDDELFQARARFRRRVELTQAVEAWTCTRSTEEIVALAAALRVPAAPLSDGRSVRQVSQFQERGVFVPTPQGFLQPRVPYQIGEALPRPFGPLPEVKPAGDVGTGRYAAHRPEHEAPEPASGAPFDGLRVIDLTTFIAGASATQLLAAFGADVVKVESPQRPDGLRFITSQVGSEQWWERGPVFQIYNRNKRSLTLDLLQQPGRDIIARLLQDADVLIENYTPRVLEQFGLDWDAVHEINPRLIMVRLPAFGLSGPWRDRPGFAQTMELVSGLASSTGYSDGPPVLPRGPCDVIASLHGVFALTCALEERSRTGRGMLTEAPMVESILNISAELSIADARRGELLERHGNGSRHFAPQGVYACRGHLQWLALSVPDDAAWERLVLALGHPDWARDPEFSGGAGRSAAEQELSAHLAEWFAEQDRDHAFRLLSEASVLCAPVLPQREVPELAQLVHRGFFYPVEHPVIGSHLVPNLPFLFASRGPSPWLADAAPLLGQHNKELLGPLALSEAEWRKLDAEGVISSGLLQD